MALEARQLRTYTRNNVTLTEETRSGDVYLVVTRDGKKVLSASGPNMREASKWLVRHANRLARHTEDLLVEVGALTVEEVDATVDDDEARGK